MEEGAQPGHARALRCDRSLPQRRDPRHEDGARPAAPRRPPGLPPAAALLRRRAAARSRRPLHRDWASIRDRELAARDPAIAVVGAGRRRQGLGPFVARAPRRGGRRDPGLRRDQRGERGRGGARLGERSRHRRARLSRPRLPAALRAPRRARDPLAGRDARATPGSGARGRAARAVREALRMGACRSSAATARRLALAFDARGLLLWENCLWPYVLPAFERLHPGALARTPRRLAMRLQPASRGAQMLGDSVPHVLSLAQALLPGGPRPHREPALRGRRSRRGRARPGLHVCGSGDRALGGRGRAAAQRTPPARSRPRDRWTPRAASGQPPTDTGYPSPPTAARCRCPIR